MKILLTNDDGVYAQGIYAAARELKKVAPLTVVAPDSERSSVGHGITLVHPIWYKKVNRKGRMFGYGITGTPADCVKFAAKIILKKKPDLIVSGINFGANDGCSVFYSGTVAGAREGALMGIPSIAVSLATFENPDFNYAARLTAKLARKVLKEGLPQGTFLNVNVPNVPAAEVRGVRFTKQGKIPIHGSFRKRRDPHGRIYYWMTGRMPSRRKSSDVDTCALADYYVTITPIHCDLTDYPFLETARKDWTL